MRLLKRVYKAITSPRLLGIVALERIAPLIKDDAFYLKLMFYLKVGYKLNLDKPQTFNEKLNWLKIYYHNPIMPILADKYEVKKYVTNIIGEKYVVPCYGVWSSFDEIDFDRLPKQFVLKPTNDSLGPFICKDRSSFKKEKAQEHIEKGLKQNYFYSWREWGYKDVARRILADQYLEDGTGAQLRDYKFWCFDGIPTYMYCTIKGDNIYENFYDMDFNPVSIDHGFPRHKPEFEKPDCFDTMKELAGKLAGDLPFVRVDFFCVKGKVYFGEFTFYDWAGMVPFASYEQDFELGKLIPLREYKDIK